MRDRLGVRTLLGIALGAALSTCPFRGAAAQQGTPWDFRAPLIARGQLLQVLARYEAAAQSTAYSERLRAAAASAADSIRARLRDGDIRVGDRLRLKVEGQAQVSDTFAVGAGPVLELPVVGSVALKGVLRSELSDRIASAVDSVYRGAAVRVELLTRLVVLGGVARPGFYALPREALLDDLISAAGGLNGEAQLVEAYVERGHDRIWGKDSLQLAMRQRRTIGDLGLQAGDRLFVPVATPSDPARSAQAISYLLSLPLSLYTLLQLLK